MIPKMVEWSEIIASVGGAIGGGGVTAMITAWSNRRKDAAAALAAESEQNRLDEQQPVDQWREFATTLSLRLSKLETDRDKLQADHTECEKRHAQLEGRVHEQGKIITQLMATAMANPQLVHKPTLLESGDRTVPEIIVQDSGGR